MRYGANYWFVFLHYIPDMGERGGLGGRSTTSSPLLINWDKFKGGGGICVCGCVHLHVFIARVIMGPRKVWEKSKIVHVQGLCITMFKYSY